MLWWHAPNIMSLFSHSQCCQPSIHSFFVTSSSFFGGERKHSHFPKLKSEKVKILTSPSIFADVGTKITVMENILHAFSLDKTEPQSIMPCHNMSNRIMIHITTLMRTLKMEHDIHEMSQSITIGS